MADEEAVPPKDPDKVWQYWNMEIAAAKKREADYRKDGQEILDLYEGKSATPFNILYSNTETMMPALYSRTPRPYVERRFKDADPLGAAASKAATRGLEFLVDTNMEGYDSFHEAMRQATLAACLPGRGVTSVRYEAEMTGDYVQGETVCPKIRSWKRVLHGYARKWSNVPWIAYEEYFDKKAAKEKFGAKADKLNYTDDEPDDREKKDDNEKHKGENKVTCVYQIWDKGDKVVRYWSPHYKDEMLHEEEDPLGLTGFFDCPRPLTFVDKHDNLTPTALYTLYKQQAQELNTITKRIIGITKALKARGLYAGDVSGDLKKLMDADENELVPVDTAAALASEKGLQNAIWMLPLDQWIVVLRELMGVREACKQTIYEITGISDILRGATKASETLGAQELKNQWGTLRLKNKQAEVQRYARDILRIMLEIAASKFSEQTWAQMTGLPYNTEEQAQQLQMQMQAMQQQMMQAGDPKQQQQLQQQMQQIQQQLQQPMWKDVLKLLQNDLMRAYRIDIETNSTVEPEAAEDIKAIMEMLMACGQFMQGVAPLVVSGAMPFQAAQAMLLVIVRRFRWGSEIEQYIQQMQPPKPPDENGAEQVKKEKEMASKELEMQKKQAEGDIKMKEMDAGIKIKQKEMDLQMREAQLKVDQDVFAMNQQAQTAQLQNKAAVEGEKLKFQGEKNKLENGKFKQENVVNQKLDAGLTKGVAAMQDMVKQLMATVQQQAQHQDKQMQVLTKALTAPRIKKAVRGKDGRLEAVEEQVA